MSSEELADPTERYQQIIVPFDGSKEAQHAALVGFDAASIFDAELVLGTNGHGLRAGAQQAIKEHAQSMSDSMAIVWVEPARSPAAAIAAMSRFRPDGLICMATHARTGLLRTVYGSLAESLLARVPLPMLLLGPSIGNGRLRNVNHFVVCIDGSAESDVAIELALPWTERIEANATVVYVRTRDEVVAHLDTRLGPLGERCDIVERVGTDHANVRQTLLDIAEHSVGSVIVVPAARRRRRFEGGDVLTWLSLRSPVPILTRGTGRRAEVVSATPAGDQVSGDPASPHVSGSG